jgi:hypothetical protein
LAARGRDVFKGGAGAREGDTLKQQTKCPVRVNERGLRIGQDHPLAKLTDAEVEQLIADRGPEGAPLMSLSQLAARYGLSKSGVKGILDGRRRGQIGLRVDRLPSQRGRVQKVRVNLRMSLHHRALLHRLGGSAWLVKKLDEERR